MIKILQWSKLGHSALTDLNLSFAAYMSPYLTIWAENVAFVYDTTTAEWLQTIPLKRVKPLCRDGSIGLSYVSDIPRLVYFRNVYHGKSRLFSSLFFYKKAAQEPEVLFPKFAINCNRRF